MTTAREQLFTDVEKGNLAAVQSAINTGIDINAKNDRGVTALHQAAFHDHYDIVKLLIEKGANVNLKDKNGATALHHSTFMSKDCNIPTNHYNNITQLLIEKGANVNARGNDAFSCPPLSLAAMYGNVHLVKYLLEKGANVNLKDKNGATALQRAARHCSNIEVFDILIAAGADVSVVTKDGETIDNLKKEHERHEEACRASHAEYDARKSDANTSVGMMCASAEPMATNAQSSEYSATTAADASAASDKASSHNDNRNTITDPKRKPQKQSSRALTIEKPQADGSTPISDGDQTSPENEKKIKEQKTKSFWKSLSAVDIFLSIITAGLYCLIALMVHKCRGKKENAIDSESFKDLKNATADQSVAAYDEHARK